MQNIPLFKILWDDDDLAEVERAITAGSHWAIGPNVSKFENRLAEFVGTDFCTVFNSGTSALHSTLLAMHIGSGDEVIVPSFTFIATANAPLFTGAKPIFADIEEETYGLDPEDVKERITQKTKAIIPIHYGGCPCKIGDLREVADDYHLALIEDAAEALGARIGSKRVGGFGDSAVLSFCQNKIITTGEGGAVVTNSKEVDDNSRRIRSHGRSDDGDYFSSNDLTDYLTIGYNFRMSNITAALGLSQLSKIHDIIEMRRQNAEFLTSKLKKEVKDVVPPIPPQGYYHVYQMYSVRAPKKDKLMTVLADRGIATKTYFYPVHLTSFYKNLLKCTCELPITEKVSNEILALPMYPGLTEDEMSYTVDEIKNFYDNE